MECRLVIYIRPGTGRYGLTTHIRLRNEFCNTESSYDENMSGLHSYLIFPNTSFMCAYSTLHEHLHLHHLVNLRLELAWSLHLMNVPIVHHTFTSPYFISSLLYDILETNINRTSRRSSFLDGRLSQPVIFGHFPSRKFTIHQLLFIIYYSPVTIHHFTIPRVRTPFVIPRNITIHMTLFIPGGKSLFMTLLISS